MKTTSYTFVGVVFVAYTILVQDLRADNAVMVRGGSLSLVFRSTNLGLHSVTDANGHTLPAEGAGVQFLDGRTKKALLPHGTWTQTNEAWTFMGRLKDSPLTLKALLATNAARLSMNLEITNPGAETQLIQIAVALPALTGKDLCFYDGYAENLNPTQELRREGLGGRLPLAAQCNEATGLAVGIDAQEMHGWLFTSFLPGRPDGFLFAVRRVIDSGSTERATFLLYGFDPKWGTATAVERYYDLFPECFQVAPGVDPRIHLAGGYVHGGPDTRPLQWEESRRLHHSWQPNWGFVRTGDWMPDEKHWFPQKGKLSDYLASIREFYSQRAPGNLILHYLEVTQCEATLAQQEFVDSITWSKTGPTQPFMEAVPVILGQPCCHMFPFANSFYRSTAAEIPQIIGDLKASGIYIDNASGTKKTYKPDLKGVPGRAFDDDGAVFAVSGVGTAALADIAHGLKAGRYNAPVTCNGVGSYLVAFHTDATIQEGTPWERPEGVAAMRRLMGGKTLCWWEDHLPGVLRVSALTPAQVMEAMKANIQYCILYGLRWGVLPAVHVQRGRAELVKIVPLLVDLVKAGWRPVTPVKTDTRLWVGRFGKGESSIITVSNPTRETIRTDLAIDCAALGLPPCTFTYHTKTAQAGTALPNKVEGGYAKVTIQLPPKEYRVLVPACAPKPDSITLASPREEILSFPFLKDGAANAVIVLAANAPEPMKIAAMRLSVYFEYWAGRNANLSGAFSTLQDSTKRLKIIEGNAPASFPIVRLTTETDLSCDGLLRVEREGEKPPSLIVAGKEPYHVDDTMLRLLSILDERYPVSFGLERNPLTEKAGLVGKEFTGRETPPPAPPVEPEPEGLVTLPAGNLLLNGGFEEGAPSPAAWRYSSPVPELHKCEFSTDAKEGKRAVFIPKGQYWQQNLKPKKGARYRFSVWRKLTPNSTLMLWCCYIRKDGTEAGGPKIYEQCQPNNGLVPDFLPAEFFNQPNVWQRTELIFTATDYPEMSLRVGGWGKVLVDAVALEEIRKP